MEDYAKRFKRFLEDSVDILAEKVNSKGYSNFCNYGLVYLQELADKEDYGLKKGDKFIIKALYNIFDNKVLPLVKAQRFITIDKKLKSEILEEMVKGTKIIHTPVQ